MTIGGRDFEDEVRRVARQLWPSSQYDGAAMADDRERDGIFETEWMVHLVEATTWRTKDKAQYDIEKLVKLRRRLHARSKPVLCWFVTESEPTAEQRGVAPKDGSVRVLSFEQFRSQLVDAHEYLRDRRQYAFGSARDPETGGFLVKEQYLPVALVAADNSTASLVDVATEVARGKRIILLGDYGVGKSMALREAFTSLAQMFARNDTYQFPIHLNLRDHHGQTEPAEALERHARGIGFPESSKLVRGWRAGYSHLLLDGFDEMATPGWVGPTTRMREIRRGSVELVRRLVRETPTDAGILLAGREHYFDSTAEMADSLGAVHGFRQYRVGEFTEDQIARYLKARGWPHGLPDWLPGRPLLLAYLTAKGILQQALDIPAGSPPAMAWNQLLDLICQREADIEANIDGTTLREVVERLASLARARVDGLGPIDFQDIDACFRDVSGFAPDDRAMVLLQRLPGLGQVDPEDGTRRFVDADLTDTARTGDVFRYLQNPFAPVGDPVRWNVSMGDLGIDVLAYRSESAGLQDGQIVTAARQAGEGGGQGSLTSDVVRLASHLGATITGGRTVFVDEAWLDSLRLEDMNADLGGVEFRDCVVSLLELPRDAPAEQVPTFTRCQFGMIDGRSSERDLPLGKFIACQFEAFSEAAATTSQLLDRSLPASQRVALTVLKKLFAQRGRGRKEGALFRGLDQPDRVLVPEILTTVAQYGLALRSQSGREAVWLPVRGATGRVMAMLDAPTTCRDEAWLALGRLSSG